MSSFKYQLGLLTICLTYSSYGQINCSKDKLVGQWRQVESIPGVHINVDSLKTLTTKSTKTIGTLDLKADGTFENDFGGYGGIGTYRVNGNSLTLNHENKPPTTYTLTFGEDGKRTFGLTGKTLNLVNKNGVGYKLER